MEHITCTSGLRRLWSKSSLFGLEWSDPEYLSQEKTQTFACKWFYVRLLFPL